MYKNKIPQGWGYGAMAIATLSGYILIVNTVIGIVYYPTSNPYRIQFNLLHYNNHQLLRNLYYARHRFRRSALR